MRITQQTSTTTVPLRGQLAGTRDAPQTESRGRERFDGPLQWLLEGSGWDILRPVSDFVLLAIAVVVALGGVHATLHVSALRAPLLALPPLVMGLLYLRGLYRNRLRALILDGLLPVMSAVSVGVMGVAMLGFFVNGKVFEQGDWLRTWGLSLLAVGVGRIVLASAQRWARSSRRVGKPVLI